MLRMRCRIIAREKGRDQSGTGTEGGKRGKPGANDRGVLDNPIVRAHQEWRGSSLTAHLTSRLRKELVEGVNDRIGRASGLRGARPNAKQGLKACTAGGLEFGADIGEKHDLGRRALERHGDATITLCANLGSAGGIEVGADEGREITLSAMAEE